jgi:dienelactone hydrolase
MPFLKNRSKKKLIISLLVVFALAVLVGACALYLGDYYRADQRAIDAFAPMNEVDFYTLADQTVVFEPKDATVGIIFYPGGKVDHRAYKPLMAACAKEGILCVLVEMPFRLAVLDINAADGIQENYPQIKEWYIGGHSLGGSMAASYLAKHPEAFEGLILLGSYSTADLSEHELKVLSIYGSEDLVLNREKYEQNKGNLPANSSEQIIQGGCHAYFGMYGEQEGDGTARISNEEQIAFSAEQIAAWIFSKQ